jgi:hypothetical protein
MFGAVSSGPEYGSCGKTSIAAPPSRVDEPGARLHPAERRRVDHAARLVVQRQVDRDEVGALEDTLEGVLLDARLAEALGRDEGVVGDHVHLQAESAARDPLTDAAEPEHSEGLLRKLDAAPLRPLPPSLAERGVSLRDVACEREEQADRVLRRRNDVRLGRVRHDDPAAGGRLDVDVVDADAGAADHAQVRAGLDQVRCELRRGADHDRVVAPDDRREVALGVDVDVELRPQEVDARLGDLLAHEDSRAAAHVTNRSRARG